MISKLPFMAGLGVTISTVLAQVDTPTTFLKKAIPSRMGVPHRRN